MSILSLACDGEVSSRPDFFAPEQHDEEEVNS